MPSKQLSQAQNVDPITRLTSTEIALLSPTDKGNCREELNG